MPKEFTILLILCATNTWGRTQNVGEFSRKYVSVWFSPRIFPGDSDIPDMYRETELLKMIETISSKFSKIYVGIPDATQETDGQSEILIPGAVAKFNKENDAIVEVTVTFPHEKPHPGGNYSHSNFNLAKRLANKANTIFNGTVSSLVLSFAENVTVENMVKLLDYARQEINLETKYKYKLGVLLNTNNCFQHAHIDKLLNLVDLVILTKLSTSTMANHTSNYDNVINHFEDCYEMMNSVGRSPEVGYFTGKDKFQGDSGNDLDLVHFWRKLNQWGKRKSRNVILYEAFDNFNGVDKTYEQMGWWRGKVGKSDSLLDFELEEKADLMEKEFMKESIPFKNFSKDHIMVYFSPTVSSNQNSYSEADVHNMINKISTQFKKVALKDSSSSYLEGINHTALAFATWNKNYRPLNIPPMEVQLECGLELSTGKNEASNCDMAEALAHKTNKIFPGTVNMVMMRYDKKSNMTLEQVEKQMKKLQRKDSLKKGLLMGISDCGRTRSNLSAHMSTILENIDEVSFYRYTTDIDTLSGVNTHFLKTFREFEVCLEKVRSKNNIKPVSFRTFWPEVNKNGEKNVSNFVEFWERSNNWAVAMNTTVGLWEAFDNVKGKQNSSKTLGWWKLDESRNYTDSSKFEFLEKAQEVRPELTEEDDIREPAEITNGNDNYEIFGYSLDSSVMWIIVAVVILILILIMIICYVLMMRNMKNEFLTREEIQEFFKGRKDINLTSRQTKLDALAVPYNDDIEILKKDFKIRESELLGEGVFGVVYRASVRTLEEERVICAVKTTSALSPPTALKSLLGEIKILMYIGEHKNILNLIGANTSDLLKGKVYVFLELCSNGSLEKYLRKWRSHYTNQMKVKKGSQGSLLTCNDEEAIDLVFQNVSSDLNKWSCEIARGMEFLSGKNVVHGDLATRNVLLTEDKTAKISDFGLSRKLYEARSKIYEKKQDDFLPWRWMAPEALSRSEFSEKSDVWSFGVTLWEIYSLGEFPYPGISLTEDFLKKIDADKLPMPKYGSLHAYATMLKCWTMDPSGRASFTELVGDLHNISCTNRATDMGYVQID